MQRSYIDVTLSPRKKEQLSAFLTSLPEAAALRLFAALEADRTRGGKDLPYNELLFDLRRRLLDRGAVLPARKLDAKRIFFTPFEDFFIGEHIGKKRRGRIARTSLEPLWRLMMTDATLAETALAAAALDDALAAGGDMNDLDRLMFNSAAAGLAKLCDSAKDEALRKSLVDALYGEAAFMDMIEIRRLLPNVDALEKLQAAVPAPAASLTEEHYDEFRALFLATHEHSPEAAAYLLLALKGRLEKPWRALGVYYRLAHDSNDKLKTTREAVMALAESIFEDVEHIARNLERDCAGPFDAASAIMQLDYVADYAEGLLQEATAAGDNVFINRIEACCDVVADALDRFAEQALSALREATPVRRAGGSGQVMALRPDIAKPLSARRVRNARAAAALMATAPSLAERFGADPSASTGLKEEAHEQLHTFANDLVAEIRAAEDEERKAARRMLDYVLKIAEPLLSSDEIGLIRDRAAAAAMTV